MALTGLKNHASMERCSVLTVVAPSGGYAQGEMAKVQDTVVIVQTAADVGDSVSALVRSPHITVPCAAMTTGAYTVGSKVYFDAADAEVNESASGNTLCGFVRVQPAIGAEEIEIDFDGTLGVTS